MVIDCGERVFRNSFRNLRNSMWDGAMLKFGDWETIELRDKVWGGVWRRMQWILDISGRWCTDGD